MRRVGIRLAAGFALAVGALSGCSATPTVSSSTTLCSQYSEVMLLTEHLLSDGQQITVYGRSGEDPERVLLVLTPVGAKTVMFDTNGPEVISLGPGYLRLVHGEPGWFAALSEKRDDPPAVFAKSDVSGSLGTVISAAVGDTLFSSSGCSNSEIERVDRVGDSTTMQSGSGVVRIVATQSAGTMRREFQRLRPSFRMCSQTEFTWPPPTCENMRDILR